MSGKAVKERFHPNPDYLHKSVLAMYIMCCAVCHLVYFACEQCSSARKGWQHSNNVQEEAGSEPPTKKQCLRK